MQVSASLFSNRSDRSNADILKEMENAGVDMVHFDFTDTRAIDDAFLREVRSLSILPFDAHITRSDALEDLGRFETLGFDQCAVEAELLAQEKLNSFNSEKFNMKVGLAFEVCSQPEDYIPLLDRYDYALVMATKAGVSGMKFHANTFEIIREVQTRFPGLPIEVDGGVKEEQLPELQKLNVDIIVSGSGLLSHPSIRGGMASLKQSQSRLRKKNILTPLARCPVITQDTPFESILATITRYKKGGCMVLDAEQKLCGVIVDGDLRRAMQNIGKEIFDKNAHDLMNADPIFLEWGSPSSEILSIIERAKHTLSIIPILSTNGTVLGCTSSTKIVKG